MARRFGITSHNPFIPTAKPWCHHCQDATDVDLEGGWKRGVMIYIERCRRCKQVIQHGTYNAPLVGGAGRTSCLVSV